MNEEDEQRLEAEARIAEAAEKSKESYDKARESVENYSSLGSKAVSTLSDASKRSAYGVSDSMEAIRKSASTTGSDMVRQSNVVADASKQMGRVSSEISKFAISTAAAFGNYSKTMNDDIKTSTTESMESIQSIMKNAGKNLPNLGLLEKIGLNDKDGMSSVLKSIKDIADSAEGVENYRSSLMSMAATRGDLSSFFKEVGTNFENLDGFLKSDIATNTKLAESLGITLNEVERLNLSFSKIPGTLGATIAVGSDAVKQMSLLEAAVSLAKGTGRDFASVQTDISQAMNDFGFSAQKAIEYTSRISEVSKNGNVPLETTKNILGDISSSYRLYGNNVDAASRLTLKFYDNLRQSGVSIKDSQEMIKSFSQSVTSLTLSQKAFLSSQTGGPGGLLGGLQIEKMMADGKMDEVFDKVKNTLQKQFNGKIMTLSDVKTQEDASMFTKQRQMLTQGPLGSIVKTDAEASKVLEAFKRGEKVDPNKPGITKDGMDALVEPISTGNEIANRSATALTGIDRTLQAMLRIQGVEKGVEGISTMTDGTTLNDTGASEAMKVASRQSRLNASEDATTRVTAQKTGSPVATPKMSDLMDFSGLTNRIVDTGKSLFGQGSANVQGERQLEPSTSNRNPITNPVPRAPLLAPVVKEEKAPNRLKPMVQSNLTQAINATMQGKESEKSQTAEMPKASKALGDIKKASEASKPEQSMNPIDRLNKFMAETFTSAKDSVLGLGKGISASSIEKGTEAARETAKQAASVNPSPANAPKADAKTAVEHTHTIDVVTKGVCIDCGKKTQPSTTRMSLDPASGL